MFIFHLFHYTGTHCEYRSFDRLTRTRTIYPTPEHTLAGLLRPTSLNQDFSPRAESIAPSYFVIMSTSHLFSAGIHCSPAVSIAILTGYLVPVPYIPRPGLYLGD